MATQPRPWPDRAKALREETEETASLARMDISELIKAISTGQPTTAAVLAYNIDRKLELIQRNMEEASRL